MCLKELSPSASVRQVLAWVACSPQQAWADYLLEKPLKADIAFLRANIVDEFGNMVFLGTTNNFNPLMATAADYVVVEAEKLVKVGEIKPECVHASGIYVDGIYVEK